VSEISLNGVLIVGPYKGYYGRAEYNADDGAFHGETTDTKDVITFVGSEPSELLAAFEESIEDYLDFCKERGETPDKPFSGKFVVRTTPELHRNLKLMATQQGTSLNLLVVGVLTDATLPQVCTPSSLEYAFEVKALLRQSFPSPSAARQHTSLGLLDTSEDEFIATRGELPAYSLPAIEAHTVSS